MMKTIILKNSNYIVELNTTITDYVSKYIYNTTDIYSNFIREKICLCIYSFILPSKKSGKRYIVNSEEGKRKAIDSLNVIDYRELIDNIVIT